jgi:hypothetical protein
MLDQFVEVCRQKYTKKRSRPIPFRLNQIRTETNDKTQFENNQGSGGWDKKESGFRRSDAVKWSVNPTSVHERLLAKAKAPDN